MEIKLPNYRYANIAGLTAAIALHTGLAAWAMKPHDPIVFPNQVMHVSFVAPSSLATNKQEKSEVTEEHVVVKEKKNALIKKKEKVKKTVNEEKAEKRDIATPLQQTSGKQAKDATAKNSAITKPVFNAEYLNNPAPVYPSRARKNHIQGKVLLDVVVNKNGQTQKIDIEHSSGSRLLDKAAVDAVRYWKFVPAKRGEEFVEARVIVPIEFRLN